MRGWLDALLERMLLVPERLLHLILGFAAAVENFVPPAPSDVVILFGGFLVGQGVTTLAAAFLVVWFSNVAGALMVYGVGRRHGARFFARPAGRFLLRPRQLASLSHFYHRFGFGVIFIGRLLPMFRSLVPVFAGVSELGFLRVALPIALASALWYGALLWMGMVAGQNWSTIAETLDIAGRWLYLIVALLAGALLFWWWRSRREEHED